MRSSFPMAAVLALLACKHDASPAPPPEPFHPPEDPPYDAAPGGPGTEYRRDSHGPYPPGTCYYEHYKGRCSLEAVEQTEQAVVARYRTVGLDKTLEARVNAKLEDAKAALSTAGEVPCAFDWIYEGTCTPGQCAIELPAATPVESCGMYFGK